MLLTYWTYAAAPEDRSTAAALFDGAFCLGIALGPGNRLSILPPLSGTCNIFQASNWSSHHLAIRVQYSATSRSICTQCQRSSPTFWSRSPSSLWGSSSTRRRCSAMPSGRASPAQVSYSLSSVPNGRVIFGCEESLCLDTQFSISLPPFDKLAVFCCIFAKMVQMFIYANMET